MKSFQEFLEEQELKQTKKLSFLSYDGSFASNRDNTPIKEEVDKEYHWTGKTYWSDRKTNKYDADYDGTFHDHPAIKPQNLTPEEETSIHHYTCTGSKKPQGFGSSSNINNYCRNRFGDKTVGVLYHDPEKVKNAAMILEGAFRHGNMNREERYVFSAIPKHIAHKLLSAGPESEHILPGFTSATSDAKIANGFADSYARESDGSNERHIMNMKAPEGSFLTAVHSAGIGENEVIFPAGTHITYHGVTEHKDVSLGTVTDASKKKIFIHHVTVDPTKRIPLDKFGDYENPIKSFK